MGEQTTLVEDYDRSIFLLPARSLPYDPTTLSPIFSAFTEKIRNPAWGRGYAPKYGHLLAGVI